MRAVAKMLTGITLVVLIFLVYVLYGGNLKVTQTGEMQVVSAAERAQEFEVLKHAFAQGEINDWVFDDGDLGEAGDYSFITVHMDVTNFGLLPAELVNMRVRPSPGNVLQVPQNSVDVSGLNKMGMSVMLLCKADEVRAPQQIWLEYYVYGRPLGATMS